MLNKRSNYLVILIATYNRLDWLKLVVDSIVSGTRCSHEIIVIDGGSTDGTIEYIESHPNITPVLQGQLLGTAKSYNEVWRQIDCKYTCWLSDDTEVVPGSLDLAVRILKWNRKIGMVGLKMKDVLGPWTDQPYAGGLSPYDILNCNHGVLPTKLLRAIGYFNESYRSYTIDPDLTASVLSAGKRVVMTKRVSVLHHREWANHEGKEKMVREMGGINNNKIYQNKFQFLEDASPYDATIKQWLNDNHYEAWAEESALDAVKWKLNRRDWKNIIKGSFIRVFDPIINLLRPYHLVQQLPYSLLMMSTNPYQHLVKTSLIWKIWHKFKFYQKLEQRLSLSKKNQQALARRLQKTKKYTMALEERLQKLEERLQKSEIEFTVRLQEIEKYVSNLEQRLQKSETVKRICND